MVKEKYYSLKKILKENATYNIIIGERSNGKTYAVTDYMIREAYAGRGQFAILRRWALDIRGFRAQNLLGAFGESYYQKLTRGQYKGLGAVAGRFCWYTEGPDGRPIYDKENPAGFLFSLSEYEHNKSLSYPGVNNILLDEFISKFYLNDEFMYFMNSISTIARDRDNVRIFMCGNTIDKNCPYFKEMGLAHILTMEQGTIDVYTYKDNPKLKVAVEYCASKAAFRKNNFYFGFSNPKLQSLTRGSWEIGSYPHLPVKYKPRDIVMSFFIEHLENIYQCDIIQIESLVFIYVHAKTTAIKNPEDDLIYSLTRSPGLNYSTNIFRPRNRIERVIADLFLSEKVFYQDNEIGDAVNGFLKRCAQ